MPPPVARRDAEPGDVRRIIRRAIRGVAPPLSFKARALHDHGIRPVLVDHFQGKRLLLAMMEYLKNPMFIRDVENLAISLGTSQLYAEARSLLREYLPMAVRVLGRDHELTFGMTETLANAISENGAAPREGLLESMNMLTENSQRLRRVLGASHPATKRNAHNLKCVQGSLARLE